jgi:ADP-ribose pyrophosphatase
VTPGAGPVLFSSSNPSKWTASCDNGILAIAAARGLPVPSALHEDNIKLMQAWKTLSKRTILNYSQFLVVEEHVIELPDGRIVRQWPWLVTPDYVNVVALTESGLFLLFRQTKYGVSGTTLALVGGYLEPSEDPLAGAQRELLEETGFTSADWTRLGSFRVDANRGVGIAHSFLARGATPAVRPDADDLEEQELLLYTRSELEAALDAGEFKVLPWPAAVLLALRELGG